MQVKISKFTNKPVRKYVKKGLEPQHTKVAKCGHVSKLGRYFNCEECVPVLPEDAGEWTYHADSHDEEE